MQKTPRSRIIRICGACIGRTLKTSQPKLAHPSENRYMPQVPIIMPQLVESIAEATVVDIKVKRGDVVADDQEIIDVDTNKAVMGVTTPRTAIIDRITVHLTEAYPVVSVP